MKKIALLILALILTACSAGATTDFDKNLAKWNDANISHYRYQLFIGCFCPFAGDMPLTIEVKDGEIVSITRFDGNPIIETDPSYGVYESYATIDRVFLKLEADQTGDADEVIVTFDSTYGFPANVAVDNIKEAIDDEISYQVSNFEVLEQIEDIGPVDNLPY